MPEQSHWLSWGYNNSVTNKKRLDVTDNFFVEIASQELLSRNLKEAITLSVEKALAYAQGNTIFLLLSGGYDSQFLLQQFSYRKIIFTPVIMKLYSHLGILNEYDFITAKISCEQLKLTPLVIEIDVREYFLSKKFMTHAKDSQCNTLVVYCFFELLSNLRDGFFIMGQGDIDVLDDHYIFREQLFNIQKYADVNEIKGCSRFYEITYDLFYWFDQLYMGLNSTDQIYKKKSIFMKNYGIDYRKKSTGFNGISKIFQKGEFDRIQLDLAELYPTLDDNKTLLLNSDVGGNIFFLKRNQKTNE